MPNRPKMQIGKTYDIYVNGKNIGDVGVYPNHQYLMGIGSKGNIIDQTRFDAWVARYPTMGWVEAGKSYTKASQLERLANRLLLAMSPEMTPQTKAFLMAARRGTFPSMKIQDVLEALKFLGWTVEDTIVPMVVDNKDFDQIQDPSPEAAKTLYEKKKREEVPSPSQNAPAGHSFITDLSKPKAQKFMDGSSGYNIFYKSWRMVPAKRVTDSKGKQFLMLPDPFDAKWWKPGEKLNLKTEPLAKWLKTESSMVIDAQVALGTGEYTPATKTVSQSKHGSGTCPACFGFYKLSSGKEMVLHGYQRPGWGATVGRCPGVGFPAYELSPKGTIAMHDNLEKSLTHHKDRIRDLESGQIKTLWTKNDRTGKPEMVDPDNVSWKYLLNTEITKTRQIIYSLTEDIKFLKRMIDTWVLRPLTEKGQIKPQWR